MAIKLEAKNINKRFDDKVVIDDISFVVNEGEFVSILGSSGCGKTTLLRIIMGIEEPDSGQILKDGEDITNKKVYERGMGIVFQNYALFPNMSVYENIAFPLRHKKIPYETTDKNGNKIIKYRHYTKEEIKEIVDKIISSTELEENMSKKPSMLSGGQQQRVAIARTLVLNPDIILFDEPMAALDAEIRQNLRNEIKSIQKKYNMTMIFITHDQEEAFALSDRIMVMNDSRIAQYDTPKNIYDHPADKYVEHFVIKHLDDKIKSIEKSIA